MRQRHAVAASVDSVHSSRNPSQDPVRQARFQNDMKLNEFQMTTIALSHIKDQYDIIDTTTDVVYDPWNEWIQISKNWSLTRTDKFKSP